MELSVRVARSSDFGAVKIKGLLWDYQYVYPAEHGNSVFYVAGFPHELVAQYQFLASMVDLNVIAMVPASFSLLHVYRYMHGAAFRRTQLAIDMIQHHNMIDYICTPDVLSRLIQVPYGVSVDRARDIRAVLISCGIFMSEGLTHEKY